MHTKLQDLTGKHLRPNMHTELEDRTCLRGIRVGMHDLTGKEQQFQHAYEVTGRGCSISRARNIRSNMPTR